MTARARRARGFTLLELSIVLTILAVLVPLIFVAWRSFEGAQLLAQDKMRDARAVRTIAEEIARDAAHLQRIDGDVLAFTGAPPCERVTYQHRGDALVREAPASCGGAQVLAREVAQLTVERGFVALELEHRVLDGSTARVPFVIGLPGGAP